MRNRYEHAGQTAILKTGVGNNLHGANLEGKEFIIEDWFENVVGCSWKAATGHPTALIYAMRNGCFGGNNNVPPFSDDVVYGKVDGMGFAFHINEFEVVPE